MIAGNVPTTDGTFATISAGSLQILNANGQLVQSLTNSTLLDGPWASAVNVTGRNTAELFVANVVGGTVTRINLKGVKRHGQVTLKVASMTQIASGYLVQANAAAVVVGPGGLAYNPKNDTLYVAATGNNEIFAVAHAGKTHADHGTGRIDLSRFSAPARPIGRRCRRRRLAGDERRRGQRQSELPERTDRVHSERPVRRPALARPGSARGLCVPGGGSREDSHDRFTQRRHQHPGFPDDHDVTDEIDAARGRIVHFA